MRALRSTGRRRPVLLAACAIVLLLLTISASGCGEDNGADQSTQPSVATYAFGWGFPDWDPAILSDHAGVLANIYETLLRYEPDSDTLTPILATDYSKSKDGLTWTFKIRQGVKFHDGTVLDAAAVKYSIERTIDLDQGMSYIWAPVKSIDAPDDATVVFHLEYPAPIDLISSSSMGAYILSPTAVKAHAKKWLSEGNEAGTGPYMLERYDMGDQVVLAKFPDYWGGWEGPHFDTAVIRSVTETTTRRQMIEAGEIDVTAELPVEDVEALKSRSDLVVDVAKSYINLQIAQNTKAAPLDDVRVRQAMAYAYPYQEAIDLVLGGYATQARSIVPVAMWGTSSEVLQYPTDPEKARQLLADAGYADGDMELSAVYSSGDEVERRLLELYRDALSDIGVTLKVRAVPWETQWEQAKGSDPPQDMLILYWYPTYPDPLDFLYSMGHSEEEPLWNLAYWSNPEYDKLIDEGSKLSATDRAAATTNYVTAQNVLQDEVPWIPLVDMSYVSILRADLQGFRYNPAYQYVVFFYDCYRQQ